MFGFLHLYTFICTCSVVSDRVLYESFSNNRYCPKQDVLLFIFTVFHYNSGKVFVFIYTLTKPSSESSHCQINNAPKFLEGSNFYYNYWGASAMRIVCILTNVGGGNRRSCAGRWFFDIYDRCHVTILAC